MRSDRSRPRKASGIIYPHFERKGGNGTDARHCHQTAANSVVLNHLKKHAMQCKRGAESLQIVCAQT
jgi:hypothetical protein